MRNLLFAFSFLFLLSCNEARKTLPKSTGSGNEIVLVISDAIWDKYPSKAIKEIFTEDYPGLQQSESFFNIIKINPADFSTIFKTHQNIILISETQKQGPTKDLWARPQLIIGMQWNNQDNEKEFLKECKRYRDIFYQSQLNRLAEKFTKKNQNIKNNFGIHVKIPSEYTIIIDSTNIFWATFNPQKSDLIKQIIVFNLEVNEINFQEDLINKIDSVLERTLKGNRANNFVQIEKRVPLEVSNNTYRGLWKMNQEFMGGPFLMKIQKKNEGEIIVSIGIVFAPGKPKKHFMIEMEALL